MLFQKKIAARPVITTKAADAAIAMVALALLESVVGLLTITIVVFPFSLNEPAEPGIAVLET